MGHVWLVVVVVNFMILLLRLIPRISIFFYNSHLLSTKRHPARVSKKRILLQDASTKNFGNVVVRFFRASKHRPNLDLLEATYRRYLNHNCTQWPCTLEASSSSESWWSSRSCIDCHRPLEHCNVPQATMDLIPARRE